jgi:tetratricopeptide (TPR) repeat protein
MRGARLKTLRSAGAVLGLLLGLLPSLSASSAPSSLMGAGGTPSFSDLTSLSVIDRVENEREDLSRVTTEIELHYGTVKSHSLALALGRISRSLTPFLLHPEFPPQVVLIDAAKPAGFYLGGETVVLTRGLVFSGLIRNTDTMAGLVALLLSRHDLLGERERRISAAGPALLLQRNREARHAALILLRAGYHYAGALEAVRVLDALRSGMDWKETLSYLTREKPRIEVDAAEIEDGASLLLSGRPAASVPFLTRFVDSDPRSIEGRFWLGLAYYRDYFRAVRVSRETLLFSVDPLPSSIPPPPREERQRRWERDFARTIWSGILRDSPSFAPAWNGLGRIALIRGHLRTALRFFGRAAHLNPTSPWYEADFALALWMRDHRMQGLRRWNDATGQAGFDPRLVYDQSVLFRMGEPLQPTGFEIVRNLPGWEFARTLWGETIGERRIRPMPSFLGQVLPAPLLPGMRTEGVRRLVGLPSSAPVHSHQYLIWDYRQRNYRLAFREGVVRIAEFYGKIRKKLPVYPWRAIGQNPGKNPEDDPVEVVPYARIAYLRYRTIHHQWVVQRVGTVLDRFIALSARTDTPGGIPRPGHHTSSVETGKPGDRQTTNGKEPR